MIGDKSGFKGLVTNVAPHVSFTHCLIHRFALAMKTLPSGLQEVLQDVVKIVNHISANITTVFLKPWVAKAMRMGCEAL